VRAARGNDTRGERSKTQARDSTPSRPVPHRDAVEDDAEPVDFSEDADADGDDEDEDDS